MAKLEDLTLFVESIKKTNRLMIGVGVFLVLMDVGMLFLPANTGKDVAIKIAIMGFFGILGALLVFLGLKKPEQHPFIKGLTERSEEIVWVYVQYNRRNGQHLNSSMVLCFDNGRTIMAPFPKEREDEAVNCVMGAIEQEVAFGFKNELQALFKKDPKALRK